MKAIMRIIGQQLIQTEAAILVGQGLGCGEAEWVSDLEMWSGLGPHSTGGRLSATRISEGDCVVCGARWFLPFLNRLKAGEKVAFREIEETHLRTFQKPMIKMANPLDLLQSFYQHGKDGGKSQDFFVACRMVKWDPAAKHWIELFST